MLRKILLVILLVLFPVSLYSESFSFPSIIPEFNNQIQKLESLQTDLIQQAELLKIQSEQLKAAEQSLKESQTQLEMMQNQLETLSKDLNKSEKQLKTWKYISIVTIAVTGGIITGVTINYFNKH